ncbi:MAG: hypothetical protein EA397_04410 [Deltaproteobacteria bacterium]|nr:MAG: hypothetical protein EA397_04410 [Deltaproteobacteria bacterium]
MRLSREGLNVVRSPPLPSLLLSLALSWLPAPAFAGFGATGPATPPTTRSPYDPLLTWRGRRSSQGAFAFGGLFEAATPTLVQQRYDPLTQELLEPDPVLRDLVGVHLGGRYALSDRVEVAVTLPMWLSARADDRAGLGLGDVGVHVPIGLAAQQVGSFELAASVVPRATLPTGASDRFLGDPSPSVGALVVGEAVAGPIIATGWVGSDLRSFPVQHNVRPGPGLQGGGTVGAVLGDTLGIHVGWRADARLLPGEVPQEAPGAPRRATGSELSVGTRAALGQRGFAGLAIAGATQQAPGTAALRMWAGGGVSFGREVAPLSEPGPTPLLVTDPDGQPVVGAVLSKSGQELGRTDERGEASLPAVRWRRSEVLAISAEGLVTAELDPPRDQEPLSVELAWRPVQISVTTRDTEGRPIDAELRFETDRPPVRAAQGMASFELPPGDYTVSAIAQGFGTQARDLALPVRGPSAEELTYILLPERGDRGFDLRVVDVEGEAVAGANLSLSGEPIGTSASGGRVRIEGLDAEPRVIDAQAETYRDFTRPELEPERPPLPVELVMTRERGAVQVVVRGPEGERVGDATARFVGADRLGPFQMGEMGRRTFVLRPGPWQLLVASPRYGLQQRALDLPDRDTALQVVEVVLQPPEDGLVDLMIRVVDPDNAPVNGAEVQLDGKLLGTTSSGGALSLTKLREGPRTLSVGGERFVDVEESLFLYEGLQEKTVVLGWQPGTTLVLARGPQGMAPDATARFAGPERAAPLPLGGEGLGFTTLGPGLWQVLVASPTLGAQQQGVAIPPESRSLHVVEAVLGGGETGAGALMVEVVDPEGEPVKGARISLDGIESGATASLGTLSMQGISTGRRLLEIAAEPFQPMALDVQVTEQERPRRVVLDYGVGALRVTARAQGKPVEDASVRLGGPRFIPSSPVDADGQRLFQVDPGQWQILVSSPRYGMEQRQVRVGEEPGLTEVEVDLAPAPAAKAQVLVRVQDPEGAPIAGATLRIDDGPPQVTGQGGLALISGIEPGPRTIRAEAEAFLPAEIQSTKLEDGPNERILTLAWEPRPLQVRVEGPDGSPLTGAEVRFDGPEDVSVARTGPDGLVQATLRPGRWRVLASTEQLGTQAGEVQLAPGDGAQTLTLRLRPAQVGLEEGLVVLKDRIYFDTGRSTLRADSGPMLDEIAAVLLAHPEIVRLEVGGHTDPIGGVPFNMELSRRRAAEVVQALIERGVAPERLRARGYGPTRPRSSNDTAEGRADNRRVEFRVEPQ